MGRVLDGLISWLMRPRVRRLRRWSFVLTVPVAALVAHVYGVHEGALVIGIRVVLWGAVAVAAWRLGGERGEALRDLLMHPRGRAFARAELDVMSALPRLLVVRGVARQAGMAYHRRTFGLALALAFTPMVVSEAVVLHLLAGGGTVAWVLTALHAYALLWLWGFALGPRAYPHRVGARRAVLRNGPMYRVQIPLDTITGVQARAERVGDGRALSERDGAVLLPARGRVDVWLELSSPVKVQRPLREPLSTRWLAVASDDAGRLVERLLQPSPVCERPATSGTGRLEAGLGVFAALDLAGGLRDAAQPS